jgi:hypothetical protein
MASLTLGDVTSTILANSYYEVLATTKLGKTTVDGKPAVTEPDDVFLVKLAEITIPELNGILDAKLLNRKDAAVRFHALFLALNPTTTANQFYDAEIVSILNEIGKSFVVDTATLLKTAEESNYDAVLCVELHGCSR